MNQKGFSSIRILIGVILTIVVVVGVSYVSVKIYKGRQMQKLLDNNREAHQVEKLKVTTLDVANEPPLKLKSIGVNLDYYDLKTGKAGDFVFTKQRLQFNRLFMGFGFVIPSNVSASGKPKANPQPTFILPLGTPVLSLVDGVVASMPTLWSGDISIQVTTDGKLQRWIYEVEHVINPKVKVGDKVTAGQIIAEVGRFDKGTPAGFGVFEIGILHGGGDGIPEHVCPFAYLDESIKEDTTKKITAFFKAWEEYTGDQSLYDESFTTPGCLTLEPIEG